MTRVAVPLDENRGLDSKISSRFARAPYFAILEVENGNVKLLDIVSNPHTNLPHGAGTAALQWLAGYGVRKVVTTMIGPRASEAARLLGIEVAKVQVSSLREVIELLKK